MLGGSRHSEGHNSQARDVGRAEMFGRDGRQRNFVGQSEEQNFKRTTDPEILPFHTGAVMGMQGSMMDARRRNGAEMAAAPTDDLNHRRRCDNELFPHYDGTVMGMQNSYAEMSHRAPGRQTHLHGSATVVTDNLNVEPSPARRPADHEIFFQAAKPVHPYSLEGEATRWQPRVRSDLTNDKNWEKSHDSNPRAQCDDHKHRPTEATEFGQDLLGYKSQWERAPGAPHNPAYAAPPRGRRDFTALADPPTPLPYSEEAAMQGLHSRPAQLYRMHQRDADPPVCQQLPDSFPRGHTDVNAQFWRDRGNPAQLQPSAMNRPANWAAA